LPIFSDGLFHERLRCAVVDVLRCLMPPQHEPRHARFTILSITRACVTCCRQHMSACCYAADMRIMLYRARARAARAARRQRTMRTIRARRVRAKYATKERRCARHDAADTFVHAVAARTKPRPDDTPR